MKKLAAVVGEYTKDGQQKAEWVNIGIINVGSNGKEYALIDPSISLAGVLAKQNVLAVKQGKQPSDMIMTSVIEEQVNNAPQQHGYQQPQQQPQQQPAPPPQGQPQGAYHQPQNDPNTPF